MKERTPQAFPDLPGDLEMRVLELIDGEPTDLDSRMRSLAAANESHAASILLWLQVVEGTEFEPAEARVKTVGDASSLQLLRMLGVGGMGEVHLARDSELQRMVAVKRLPSALSQNRESVERFLREARIAAQLDHPNIAKIHRIGEADGRPFFVMDHVLGASLDRLLGRMRACGKPMAQLAGRDWAEALVADPAAAAAMPAWPASHAEVIARMMLTVARALAHAHSRGVVHRDLKPSNIMVRPDGSPVLLDFGLARIAEGPTLTVEGQQFGTPEYSSPEQIKGRMDAVDHRSDVWSLGATMYELLTLRLPFGPRGPQLFHRIEHADPAPPRRHHSQLSRDLETICLTCLEKDPRRRYGSAAELAADLERFLEFKPVLARPVSWLGRTLRWSRRNRTAAVSIAVAVGAAVIAPTAIAVVQSIARAAITVERNEKQGALDQLEIEKAATERRAAEASFYLAKRLQQRGLWTEALAAFEQASELNYDDEFAVGLGRLQALEGLNEFEEARAAMAALRAMSVSGKQAALLDLLEGDNYTDRRTDNDAGLDLVRRALDSGLLDEDSATYAQGLLADSLVTAREHFEQVLRRDPSHRGAMIHLVPLTVLTGTPTELLTLAARLEGAFPSDWNPHLVRAIHSMLTGDSAGLDASIGRLEESGRGDLGGFLRAATGLVMPVARGGLPDMSTVFVALMQITKSSNDVGSQLSLHPQILRIIGTLKPRILPMMWGHFSHESVVALEEVFPDGLWALIDASNYLDSPDFVSARAAVARARGSDSIIARLVGEEFWRRRLDDTELGIISSEQRYYFSRGGMDPAVRTQLRDVVRRVLRRDDLDLSELENLWNGAAIARDGPLTVEISLRMLRLGLAGSGDQMARGFLAQALDRVGAPVWAHRAWETLMEDVGGGVVTAGLEAAAGSVRAYAAELATADK